MAALSFLTRQPDNYICALPLEDCLDILQSKSGESLDLGPKSLFFEDRRSVKIKLVFRSPDLYKYTLRTPLGRGEVRLNGYLKQLDGYRTEIVIEKENALIQFLKFIIFVAAILLISAWSSHYSISTTLGTFGLLAVVIGILSLNGDSTKQKMGAFLVSALPQSTP